MMLYIDGFDAYPTADIGKRWADVTGNGGWSIVSGGRNSTNCLQLATVNTRQLTRVFGSKSSVVVGFAVNIATGTIAAVPGMLASLGDGPTPQITVKVDNGGALYLYTGSGASTLLGTAASAITFGSWCFVEIKATISNSISAGAVKLCVNGVTVITVATGANVRSTANNSCDRLTVGNDNANSGKTISFDDLYIFDQTGTTNNDLIGDIRVEAIKPTGAGTSTQWTATGAASNYLAVNETTEDGDTSYVASSTVGQVDTYAMGDLSSTPATVYGVQTMAVARKDDAGSRTLTTALKSGSTTYDHGASTTLGLGDSYTTLIDVWETDPNGTVAWTGTSVNALEAGVKLAG